MFRNDADRMGRQLGFATEFGGGSQFGRRIAALALVAAGSAIALAGGTQRCRMVLTSGIEGQQAAAAGATGLNGAADAGTTGYCPGGFPPGPRKHGGDVSHADGQSAEAAAAYALDADAFEERGIDALDAARIAKAEFAYDVTRVRSVKLEALDAGDVVKAEQMWKVELRTLDMTDWCIVLEPDSGVVVLKRGRRQDGTPVGEGEIDLALKNPEHLEGAEKYVDTAKPIGDVEIQPVDLVPGDLKGEAAEMTKAMDMFEAIELVADKAEKKLPEPVPADKITDRPQPKKGPSTGSRW